MLTRRDKML